MRTRLFLTIAMLAAMLPVTQARAADPRTIRVTLTKVNSGLSSPVGIAAPNDSSGRLFIVQQGGKIRVRSSSGSLLSTPFLDLSSRITTGGERGLLGLAFHPRYKDNGYFYCFYTDTDGDLRITRFRASPPSSNKAPISSALLLMEIEHSARGNHNGGALHFGHEGYLYIATGDGGGQEDPNANAQSRKTRLGKILRIDVNRRCGSLNYCIPSSNPYATSTTLRREIWHYGLRNPWQFSFDAVTHRQYIGDVGQYEWEEVNRVERDTGGKNFGWDCREGFENTASTFGGSYCSDGRRFTPPLKTYSHANGRCAIVGGYVYRGANTRLYGIYLYADYCTGEIWGLGYHNRTWVNALVKNHTSTITAFGQTPARNLYVVDGGGGLYRVGAVAR